MPQADRPRALSYNCRLPKIEKLLAAGGLRRGIFGSVSDLIASIQSYLDACNADPRPQVWTATAESILAKIARARTALNQRAKAGTDDERRGSGPLAE